MISLICTLNISLILLFFKERYEFVEIQIDYTDLLIFAILLLDEDLSTLSFVSAALVYDGYAVITKFSAQSKQINA